MVGAASRYALGLWFGGIAVLGFVQFAAKWHRGQDGVVVWLWLGGSVALALIAAGMLLKAAFSASRRNGG